MAQQYNEHVTIEYLSAYLDDQLNPEERTICDAHLRTCKQCQHNLATLRGTVTLLRALPQVNVPRSFTLTPEVAQTSEQPERQAHAITPISRGRAPRWTYATRNALRAVSTIAAVLGVIFILSAVWTVLPQGGATTSSTGSSSAPFAGARNTPSRGTTGVPPQIATRQAANAEPTAPARPTVTPLPTPTPAPQNANENTPPQFDLGQPGIRLGIGTILLLLSILGILFTRRLRIRAPGV